MSNFVFIPGYWETIRINGKLRRYYRPYHGSDYEPRPRYGSLKIQTCYDTKACDWPCYQNPDFIEAHKKEEEENRKKKQMGQQAQQDKGAHPKKAGYFQTACRILCPALVLLLLSKNLAPSRRRYRLRLCERGGMGIARNHQPSPKFIFG